MQSSATKKCPQCRTDIPAAAKKCPNCQSDIRNFPNRHPVATFLGVLVVLGLLIAAIPNSSTNTASTSTPQDKAVAEKQKADAVLAARTAMVNEVAPVYCQNHRKLTLSKVDELASAGFPMWQGSGTFSDAECQTLIGKMYDLVDQNKSELLAMANSKIFVGMDARMLLYSWGAPNDSNTSTFSWGNHAQWIYGNPIYGANYAYIDNGKVSSYQIPN